ncbi:hypothetical protein [Streptomyces aurantiogriseus]|uniref:RuvC-like resolvase n=1 Tax=Streptomyces aurantiogriseus TaxID=66870 RepID=A0A918FNM2_9ACTN|nr:hypothetical protein [Streptomyces aurantiogriseus]GGR61106.1 hypothetical protein GCM10010251_92250 [Streptomyces aurantiogriseus]
MTTLFDTTTVPAVNVTAGTGPLVIGLDIALVTSGVAGPGWANHFRTTGLAGEDRLQHIVDTAAGYYRNADLVLIEGAAYSMAKQVGHDEMSAARWMIRCDLRRRRIPFAVVTPDSRTIYATGRARWKDEETGKKLTPRQVKGKVRDEAARRYGIVFDGTARFDQADAYVLMAMGMDWLGYSLAEVPKTHSRALKGVAWPTQTVAVAR